MSIGWPEGILLAIIVVELILVAVLHDTPRTDTWSFHFKLYGNVVLLGLLYWGGFFA